MNSFGVIKKCSTFAPAFERKHCRIDSLAQQVEHNTFNVGVLGSSPRRITKRKRKKLIIKLLRFSFYHFAPHLHHWILRAASSVTANSSIPFFLLSKKKLLRCWFDLSSFDLIPPVPYTLWAQSEKLPKLSLVSSCIYYTRTRLNLFWCLSNEV